MERIAQSGNKKEKKKKQLKDEIERLKQAEKKKRRLEKALAASAAIRLELEKKKQKKREEQQRLDEEGAAIAEAVALHVLLGEEESNDSCHLNTLDHSYDVDLFMGNENYEVYEREDDGYVVGWNPWFQGRNSLESSVGHIAAEALSSLRIADGSKREVVLPRNHNSTADVANGMLRGSCMGWEVDFYGGF